VGSSTNLQAEQPKKQVEPNRTGRLLGKLVHLVGGDKLILFCELFAIRLLIIICALVLTGISVLGAKHVAATALNSRNANLAVAFPAFVGVLLFGPFRQIKAMHSTQNDDHSMELLFPAAIDMHGSLLLLFGEAARAEAGEFRGAKVGAPSTGALGGSACCTRFKRSRKLLRIALGAIALARLITKEPTVAQTKGARLCWCGGRGCGWGRSGYGKLRELLLNSLLNRFQRLDVDVLLFYVIELLAPNIGKPEAHHTHKVLGANNVSDILLDCGVLLEEAAELEILRRFAKLRKHICNKLQGRGGGGKLILLGNHGEQLLNNGGR